MHASSSTKVIALTPEQTARLGAHRKVWADARLSAASADRARAEQGVALAYRAGGHAPPRRIVWCEGPLELARSWSAARHSDAAGGNVRSAILDRVHEEAARNVQGRFAHGAIRALFHDGTSATDTVSIGVIEAVSRQGDRLRPSLGIRMRRAVAYLTRASERTKGWPSFSRSGFSGHALGWVAPYFFIRDAWGLERETDALQGLALLAGNAGWVVPHQHTCWLSERHRVLKYDARGRLHSDKGPALSYPDGWAHYSWKGVEVPGFLIENAERVTVRMIDREPDPWIRRCMIEIMTPKRFIGSGGAARVAQDAAGTLWRKIWWTGDAWAAVEVENGSVEPDGRRQRYFLQVPAELRTPREAVAWTYGMSERQYSKLSVRT